MGSKNRVEGKEHRAGGIKGAGSKPALVPSEMIRLFKIHG